MGSKPVPSLQTVGPQPGDIEWGSEEGLLHSFPSWTVGRGQSADLTFHPTVKVRKQRSLLFESSDLEVLAPDGTGTGLGSLLLPPFTTGVGRGPDWQL